MTSAPVAVLPARVRGALATDVVALSALAALAAGLLAATWGTWGDLDSDTGYDVVAGARIADGELPYRDFVYYYGPLAPALSGLASFLGGFGLAPAVGLGLVVALAIVAATYALARILVDPLGGFLAAAITAAVAFIPNNYSFVLPHTHAATLGTLLLLGFLLCLWRSARTGGSGWLVAAGACAGLVLLTKPEPAAAVVVAGAAWIAVRARSGAAARREASLVAAPALLIAVTVYGVFLALTSPRRLFLENLYPVDMLDAGGDTLLRVRMPLTFESFAEVGGKLLLYGAGAALLVLVAAGMTRSARLRRPLVAGSALAFLLLAALALVKPDGIRDALYYIWGWVPAGALVALGALAWRLRDRARARDERAQLALAAAAVLAVLAATTYAAFVMHGWRPQMAVYYVPLAAILIARLHLVELARTREAYALGALWIGFLAAVGIGLTLKDARAESVVVRGPGGALAETPAEARLYGGALAAIEARTQPGEPILVAPLMTGLYALSGHESPLRELSVLPSAPATEADESSAVERLESAGVRLVITDDRRWPGYGHTGFGDSFHRVLAGWINTNFEQAASLTTPGDEPRTLTIWTRRR